MMKESRTNVTNPDRIGVGKFWAWQSRGASAAINFIVVSFVAIYCTDTLGMPPALVGTLLAVSSVVDAITDLFAGFLVVPAGIEHAVFPVPDEDPGGPCFFTGKDGAAAVHSFRANHAPAFLSIAGKEIQMALLHVVSHFFRWHEIQEADIFA